MDQSHGQPPQLHQHQHHLLHNNPPAPSQPSQQQQQQQQQQPQDVLAEARKNLQVLIDSGLSRDLLHQLVDGGSSLQLTLPTQSSLLSPTSSSPQHSLPPPQSQAQLQSATSLTAPPPPPPQCPPPPPPTQQQQQQQQQSDRLHQHSQQPSQQQPHSQQPLVSPVATTSTLTPTATSTTPTTATSTPTNDKPEMQGHDNVPAMFVYPNAPSFTHRPRISVSSTSSGSSGTASIWSNASNQSSMSWASAGSNCARMQAALPVPPSIGHPGGTPLMNAGQVGASGSMSKQNIYWCTSCETSFKRKYDWKRHEDEFHERWRKYPCPEPGCNRSFWGSNSFNQHHKQCHGCTTCPHADKVVKFLRKRKYWACGFCSALHPARERHVEHVARHFESGMSKGEWMHSRVVYGLLHQPLIHEAWDALITSKQSEYAGRRPRFSWHPSKTGRAQGFLEKENPGQLQDLLEFFSGDEGEAQWIASVAYDLADIVMDNVQLTPPHFPGQANMQPYQDPRMSFSTLPSQQQMLPSSDPNGNNAYASSFQSSMFMTSPPFPRTTGPSPPESTSHSPLTSNHSPISSSTHPSTIKQEPQQTAHPGGHGAENGEGLMDFEYSPAPIVFEDWESMHNQPIDEPATTQPNPGSQPNWGMMGYFNDPRVVS